MGSLVVAGRMAPQDTSPLLTCIGVNDIKDWRNFTRAVAAEFVGTLLLVFLGCGSCTGGDNHEAGVMVDDQSNTVRISVCFGLVLGSVAQALGSVSGAHLNPAVSLSLWVARQVGLLRVLVYTLAQCVGAIVGAAILWAVLPPDFRGVAGLGMTLPAKGVGLGQAVCVEFMITCLLVLVVFVVAVDPTIAQNIKGSAPLAIGLTVTSCHLFAVPLTGSSMNPARSLGPAVIQGEFSHHWIYWVGPCLGGVAGAILYQILLKTPEQRRDRGFREGLSPPYVKTGEKYNGDQVSEILVTQETEGKALVWLDI